MAEPVVPENQIEKKPETEAVKTEEPKKPEEPAPPKEEEVPKEPEAPTEDEPEDDEPKPPSRRENLRIQKLIARQKELETKIASTDLPKDALDYSASLDADPEVVKQLEADRRKYGEELYLKGVAQANAIRFQTRLEVDAPRVEAKHPQLDKESPEFHPVLADAINTMYLSSVGYNPDTGAVSNPNIRYSDYVESVFELASEIAGQQSTTAKKNIAKQVASTGLRPDGGTSKRLNLNKSPKDMSNEELEAAVGMMFK